MSDSFWGLMYCGENDSDGREKAAARAEPDDDEVELSGDDGWLPVPVMAGAESLRRGFRLCNCKAFARAFS